MTMLPRLPDNNSLATRRQKDNSELVLTPGQVADRAAAFYRFQDYQQRRSEQTLRRQKADLALFQEFLAYHGVSIEYSLFETPVNWAEISWGLVEAFVKWQLKEGYAINSVNVRLSTVKTYAKLAMQSQVLSPETYALIRSITGYAHKEGLRVNEKRQIQRVGFKKDTPVLITSEQAAALKQQPTNTPQGRRDGLLMCLLLDHGLRVSEVVPLTVGSLDLPHQLLIFYRKKVNKTQRHRLSDDTRKALELCSTYGDFATPDTPLLRGSYKNKELSEEAMTDRAITHRVNFLGKLIGLANLSAHDCRHYWATAAAHHGTDSFTLQEAGGWSSLAMPRRYIEDNEVANEGILLE